RTLTLAQHDDGLDFVLAELGRHRDRGALQHGGGTVEDGLHLARGDVLTASANGILLPVDEIEVAVRVTARVVARVKPEVTERCDSRLGHIVVFTEHYERPARPY